MRYIPLKLDKMRNLGYGMRAISLVEKKFKKPLAKIDMDSMTMEDTAVIIWAGLAHEDSDLTPDNVMDLIDQYSSFKDIGKVMNEAMKDFFGADEDEEENEAGKNVPEAVKTE